MIFEYCKHNILLQLIFEQVYIKKIHYKLIDYNSRSQRKSKHINVLLLLYCVLNVISREQNKEEDWFERETKKLNWKQGSEDNYSSFVVTIQFY